MCELPSLLVDSVSHRINGGEKMDRKTIRKIGILTSGGDAPGMNAAVRAAVRTAIGFDMEVIGIKRGYNGLIHGDFIALDAGAVGDMIQRGGTFLYTARCMEFMEEAGQKKAFEMAKKHGIEGIVVIGGDGSFRGAEKLSAMGLPTVGIPGTIDNDIVCTEYTIGYDTACNIGMEAIDRLRDTAQSHEKCSLIEVMGRKAGHLALEVGIAAGASAILVPEKEYDIKNEICRNITEGQKKGRTHHIIIMAEGCRDKVQDVAEMIEKETGISTRVTVLGHIQRGGAPTVRDRVVATRMGYFAVDLLRAGRGNRLVAMKGNALTDYNINEGLMMKKSIDETLYTICQTVAR